MTKDKVKIMDTVCYFYEFLYMYIYTYYISVNKNLLLLGTRNIHVKAPLLFPHCFCFLFPLKSSCNNIEMILITRYN